MGIGEHVQPNIVLVLADDLGFSDLGCYGGEIDTPNLDEVASLGVRLTNFYNTARCSPSRASLLTGLHPHQAGIGVLTGDDRPEGYAGDLSPNAATLAEVLRVRGYTTAMAGKWHMSADVDSPSPSWPTKRGFDRFYGTLTGCGSYYAPGTLRRGEQDASAETKDPNFFYTTAITEEAEQFISSHPVEQPFFLYAAYTAPHWPLHAAEKDVQHYAGRFAAGWDVLREQRFRRQLEAGIVDEHAALSPPDPENPSWEEVESKDWEQRRMEVYAAQVSELDKGVGRIVSALKARGVYENTILVFLSDNGASPEVVPHQEREEFMERSDIFSAHTRDGKEVQLGSDPTIWPGPEDTYASYGRAWAGLSNTPFRMYKKWVHEGGIAAPFIVHWPAGDLKEGTLVRSPLQLTSVVPTLLEAVGTTYPCQIDGRSVLMPEDFSFLSELRGEHHDQVGRTLYWEHAGNAALRREDWKIVRFFRKPWELYRLSDDPTETNDVAANYPEVVRELVAAWDEWANRVGVIPFQQIVQHYERQGFGIVEAEG